MGSFDYTCAISGLPIGAGTRVRFLMLQSSPFSARGDYASGELRWYLRSLPTRAAYNDYGTITDLEPADEAIRKNWLEGLGVDLLEKGWGDNTVHDVPTRKGMSFEALLRGLQAERLEVRPDLETAAERKQLREMSSKVFGRTKLSRGIPTIRRVEAAIRRAGAMTYTVDSNHVVRGPGGSYTYTPPADQKNYSREYDPHCGFDSGTNESPAEGETLGQFRSRTGQPGSDTGAAVSFVWRAGRWARISDEETEASGPPALETWRLDISQLGNAPHKAIVDKLRRGEIRVRIGGYGQGIEASIRLSALAKKLRRRYSVMLSPGRYGEAQLLVHPKPGTRDGEHRFCFRERHGRAGKPRACHLAQAMVREDVWQALCGMAVEFWDKEYKTVRGSLDVFRKLAREAWDTYQAKYAASAAEAKTGALHTATFNWKTWSHGSHNPIGHFTGDNPSIGGFGMDVSWLLFARQPGHTEAEVENFLDVLAQTVLVDGVLGTIRMQWRPVGSNGPQCGEWGEHRRYLRRMLRIAEKKVRRDEIRRAEDRGWSKRWDQEQAEKKARAAKKKAAPKP